MGFEGIRGSVWGFSTRFLNEIPTGVFEAIDNYFSGIKGGAAVYNYATAVNPQRESSKPHVCRGLGNSIDPGYGNSSQIDTSLIASIMKRRMKYSGVIPPGATKAIELNIGFLVADPQQIAKNPELLQVLSKNNEEIIANRTVIVAAYPNIGWKIVYVFPMQHSGYATP